MAPLKLPPPALTVDEANELGQALVALGGEFSSHFTGHALEKALQDQAKYSKVGAAAVCEALLEHRLMHSDSDDDGFSESKRYVLISEESPEVRSLHAAQSKLIDESLVQGKILWKRSSFFGLMTHFDPVYGVLSQDKLTLLKSRSAAALPLMEIPVQELHEQRECINCKAEWYCFDILTKHHGHIVLCADHSKRQEAWMSKLNEMGVTFVRSNDIENDDVTKFNNLFELEARRLNSEETVPFSKFQGNVCLVVNVSTLCGLTPQYAELETLYEKYKDRGFRVLGFPVNQFLNQEPGTEAEIEQFAKTKYNVTFDMFEKTNCNGKSAHPVFRFVKSRLGGVLGSSVKWNFTKFLIDRNGTPVLRFAPTATPLSFEEEIVALL